jgi:transposase
VQLDLTAAEAHDNRLAGKLLSRPKSGTMLLADRGYDADWIRALAAKRCSWANIPPRSNRNEPICFNQYLYPRATWSSGFSTRSSDVGVSRHAMTSSQRTTSPSSSLHQSGFGYALMSPRPNFPERNSLC